MSSSGGCPLRISSPRKPALTISMQESPNPLPGWVLSSTKYLSLTFGAVQAWQTSQPLPVFPASLCILSFFLCPQSLPVSPSLSLCPLVSPYVPNLSLCLQPLPVSPTSPVTCSLRAELETGREGEDSDTEVTQRGFLNLLRGSSTLVTLAFLPPKLHLQRGWAWLCLPVITVVRQ